MKLCSKCGIRPAEIYQAHSNKMLCKECFLEDVRNRAIEEIKRWNMIKSDDIVMMALSGGKDGYVLLDVLGNYFSKSNKLIGLNIIEGIHGYNKEEDAKYLVKTAKEYGVDVIVTSIKDYIGYSMDEIYEKTRNSKNSFTPCTYCGASRRRIMNYYAREMGATKLATAHNLDDEAQTAVINLMKGDINSLLKQHPNINITEDDMLVKRIKPLRKIYEWENASFTFIKNFHIQQTECPYIELAPTLRAKVRRELYKYERENPGVLIRFMETLDILLEYIHQDKVATKLNRCIKCGEPTTKGRNICKLCELLSSIGISNPSYLIKVPKKVM
ncbi:TIGR00269 family protein [Caldisphaera lagunensis DSM 15908]|uniref:TIGR00269 family protein n=1 Tax=Caldisphaera lagunensis (strain DSM 15908 / JCM 11604 / ANMR 0165 / IC-154) TaxID=1056495 RepID=L0ABF0_CALLD|nr:TIGR00269 family protein [Caldisphaera lagunensis]AFZ70462.1 TIGR00269 family protein [Caldisphaera lagunensis DSM 15908]